MNLRPKIYGVLADIETAADDLHLALDEINLSPDCEAQLLEAFQAAYAVLAKTLEAIRAATLIRRACDE